MTTVRTPQTAIERPPIAPCKSPISKAFDVPIACPLVPQATPCATGSEILKILQKMIPNTFARFPAIEIRRIVTDSIPPFWFESAIPIGVVIDLGRRETYSVCPILKIAHMAKMKNPFAKIPAMIPRMIAGAFSFSFENWR